MREVKGIADTMTDLLANLKRAALASTEGFKREVSVSHENIRKVNTVTSGLREANQHVSKMLAETGSNFPTPEEGTLETPKDSSGNGQDGVNIHGVTDHGTDKVEGVDHNGVTVKK